MPACAIRLRLRPGLTRPGGSLPDRNIQAAQACICTWRPALMAQPLVAVPVRCVFRKLSTRTAKRGKLNAGMGLGPLADVSLAGAMSN